MESNRIECDLLKRVVSSVQLRDCKKFNQEQKHINININTNTDEHFYRIVKRTN